MTRKLVRLIVVLLTLFAATLALQPASADDAPALVGINPDPVLLTYTGPPPHGCPGNPTICYVPMPLLTLSLSGALRLDDAFGGPSGEEMVFSIGAKPTAARPLGTLPVCRAVTDSVGRFSCTGSQAFVAVLLAIANGGGWVSHPATAQYSFAVSHVPLVQQMCDNPFC